MGDKHGGGDKAKFSTYGTQTKESKVRFTLFHVEEKIHNRRDNTKVKTAQQDNRTFLLTIKR